MKDAIKKFMDKAETKKTFKMFERQLKNLFDIVISKFEEQDLTDAMAAKKPLGGWSCISCTKNLVNLNGALSEYQVQGKFPWRDPQDRLHKVGAGFSKMLSSLRPETTSNVDIRSQFNLTASMSQQNLRGSLANAQLPSMNGELAPLRGKSS